MNEDACMSPGQMRQLIALIGSTVPADLSHAEVERLLRGPHLREGLNRLWAQQRSGRVYTVSVPQGDLVEIVRAEGLVEGFKVKDHEALVKYLPCFEYTGDRGPSVKIHVRRHRGSFHSVRKVLARAGFRPADLRELVGLVLQFVRVRHPNPWFWVIPNAASNGNSWSPGAWHGFNQDWDQQEYNPTGLFWCDAEYCETSGTLTDADYQVLAVKL